MGWSLARLGGGLRGLVHRDLATERQRDLELLVSREARARRDQVTHDDVFLKAAQGVDLAQRRGVGEDARRLLEGGGRDEALGLERGLGDAQQDRLGLGGFAAGSLDALVLAQEGHAVDLLAPEPLGVTRIRDANLTEHLADDDLDVLVVNRHALETIDFLHLADEELVERGRPEDLEDLVRIGGAFGQVLALVDDVAGLHDDVLAVRDQVFLFGAGLFLADDELALAADGTFERNDTLDAGHLGGFLRAAGFEQLGHARETTGDVLGHGRLARRLGEQGTRLDDVTLGDRDLRARRDGVSGDRLAVIVANFDLRIEVFLVLDDHGRDAAGGFVEFALHGHTRDHVLEVERAGLLGENRDVVRIPLGDRLALGDLVRVSHGEEGADHNRVGLELAIVLVEDLDGTGLVEDDVEAFRGLYHAEAAVLHDTGIAHLDLGVLGTRGGDAADVEGTHRKLRARLADRLGGDNADGVTDLRDLVGRGIDAVGLGVHGHVAKLAGHVTGVGRLEGGVGETLAGAVRGDEVLEHREALAERGQNRALDDFAGGLGHEAAETAQLANLLFVTAGTGVHHDVHRVNLGLAVVVLELAEHRFRDAVGGAGPDVDDLVVALAGGDDALLVLGLDLVDLLARVGHDLLLVLGDDHVVDTDRDAGLHGGLEAELLELVERLNRYAITRHLVGVEDEVAEFALRHREVDEAET